MAKSKKKGTVKGTSLKVLKAVKEVRLDRMVEKLPEKQREVAEQVMEQIMTNVVQHRILNELIIDKLEPGLDYGYIEYEKDGRMVTTKPFLWKPGAEKILKFTNMKAKIKDVKLGEKGVVVQVEVINKNGDTIADGIGGCEIGGSKRGFKELNVAVKMAKKRALIDAVLTAFGLSSRFTQDADIVEEMTRLGEWYEIYNYAEELGLLDDKKVVRRLKQAEKEGRSKEQVKEWLEKVREWKEKQQEKQQQKEQENGEDKEVVKEEVQEEGKGQGGLFNNNKEGGNDGK